MLGMDFTDSQLSNAYRNLIVPPLTLGISIFFALLNLAQWFSMTIAIFQKRLGLTTGKIRLLTATSFSALLLLSFSLSSPLVDSRAYQEEFKKPLFGNDFFLGVITAFSAQTVPNWYFLSKTCNQYVLGGVQLKRPY